MKLIERLIIKLVVIQFLLLIVTQLFVHSFQILPGLNKVVFYEGVNKMEYSELIEAMTGIGYDE